MDNYLPDLYQPEEFSDYKNEYKDYMEETFYEVLENCVLESVKSIYNAVWKTIACNIIFGLITTLGLPEVVFHWFSAICGIYLLRHTIHTKDGLSVIFVCFLAAYFILLFRVVLQKRFRNKLKSKENPYSTGPLVQYGLIVVFVLFEYIILETETWLQIRGVMLIFSMKLICIASDIDSQKLPNFSEYCGYMFCCGNVLFGPWITFEHYILQARYPSKKNALWIFGVMRALIWSLFFLSISNCWATYVIGANSTRWLMGYREALSFRTSHYFICYLSEAFMLAAGWKDLEHHFDDQHWELAITKVLKIECPSALAIVVVNWNKPMHEFLKKYIYRRWLPLGKFYAVLLTFIISSLFHGFELKVSTVLICLGIFSYLQILVREHISQAFNICVKVHPCKICTHKVKRDSLRCKIMFIIFSGFTVLHLIYVGVLMDQSTDVVGIYQKWRNLHFLSLWIMFVNFLIVK